MPHKDIKVGDWITIGDDSGTRTTYGYVFKIYDTENLEIGYVQYSGKAVKDEVTWNGEYWNFKNPDSLGRYLHTQDEHIVLQGPPR